MAWALLPTPKEIAKWEYLKDLRTRAGKRRFQRMISGLSKGIYSGEKIRFLTLSSPKSPKRYITDSFRLLKLRISRATIDKDGFVGFKFNKYFKLHTLEGPVDQVFHILYIGRYIPKDWLHKTWADIHGAWNISIKEFKADPSGINKLTNYLLTNYFSKQPVKKMSYGWRWVWRGFCHSWRHIKEVYYRACSEAFPDIFRNGVGEIANALYIWDDLMKNPLDTNIRKNLCRGAKYCSISDKPKSKFDVVKIKQIFYGFKEWHYHKSYITWEYEPKG